VRTKKNPGTTLITYSPGNKHLQRGTNPRSFGSAEAGQMGFSRSLGCRIAVNGREVPTSSGQLGLSSHARQTYILAQDVRKYVCLTFREANKS